MYANNIYSGVSHRIVLISEVCVLIKRKSESVSIFIFWFMIILRPLHDLQDSSFFDIFIGGSIAAKIQYQFAPVP